MDWEKQENDGLEPVKPVEKFDKFFGITASGSNYKTEIIAGVTTFMAMVYALLVVPAMYGVDGAYPHVSFNAVYIATALGAIVGTTLMALLAKMPLAQASGLGATVYVTGTLLGAGTGLTYANSMIFVLLDGVIFILLTATGLRKKILKAIPDEVKISIPVGIGLFIAFIGFKNAGLVTFYGDGVGFASFNVLGGKITYLNTMSAVLALVGVIAIGVLSAKKVKGGILCGML
ncbi:MAG: NCS2 family permease [Clostridia bacterium]|nr:NCS2 family permease [Clostridia bacterium]